MQHRSILSAALLLTLSGCSASEKTGDGWQPGASTSLPAQPATFQIILSGSACFGSCPTYSASIDQDGNVKFVGERCVARPGVFTHKVSGRDAQAVYDALYATPYRRLADRYTTKEDGCLLASDAPTYSWQVSADDASKPLERYRGCEGVKGLAKVDAVMEVLHQHADVVRFLEPSPGFACEEGGDFRFSETNLRLSLAGEPRAILKIRPKREWSASFTLETCTGEQLAAGDIGTEISRWILISEDHEPIAVPGAPGPLGSLVVSVQPDAPFESVRGLLEDDEVEFDFAPGESCAP